jgi:hypothetical protein
VLSLHGLMMMMNILFHQSNCVKNPLQTHNFAIYKMKQTPDIS